MLQLPDVAPPFMADRLSRSVIEIASHAGSEGGRKPSPACLTNVKDTGTSDPSVPEHLGGDSGITSIESAGRARLKEDWNEHGRPDDDIHPRLLWNPGELRSPKGDNGGRFFEGSAQEGRNMAR